MITIIRFPREQHSLSEMMDLFKRHRFEICLEWYYNPEGDLRVNIKVNGEEREGLENTISSWLSANNYQYIVNRRMIIQRSWQTSGMRRFALSPTTQQGRYIKEEAPQPVLNKDALLVLATGIQQTNGGMLTIMIGGDGGNIRAAVSVSSKNGIPQEVEFAFSKFSLRASNGLEWFEYNEGHSYLLSMPYCPEKGSSLITGFGGERQALQSPDPPKDVTIGAVYNSTTGMKLCFTEKNAMSSTSLFGMPGYGKSTLINSILAQCYAKMGIKFLVIEPKREYRSLVSIFPEMNVISSLRESKYNPLLPPPNCDPYEWCEVVLDLLNLATPLPPDSPLPDYIRNVFYKAIEKDDLNMGRFIEKYDDLMKNQHLVGQAINFVIAGRHRLESFFRCFAGNNFRTCKERFFDIRKIMQRPTVIEIGDCPSQRMISLFTYFVVSHLRMFVRGRGTSKKITNFLVLEEAHSVLAPILPDFVRNDIENIVAEGRSKGISTIVIDQSPSRISQAATDLCGNNFSFRLVSQNDRDYAAAALGVHPDELNQLQKFSVMARTNSMFQPETVLVEVTDDILQLKPLSNEEVRDIWLAAAERARNANSA